MNVLIDDLLQAAGPVMVDALNALPEGTRTLVAEAIDAGGWTEVRVGMLNEAACVMVMLVNLDGKAVQLARVDHVPH